jgi:general secretion pathway protein A
MEKPDMNSEIYEALGIEVNPFPPGACRDCYYQTEATRRILDELLYGITARKGFLVLVGEVGLGKTSLLLQLLPKLEQENIRSSWVFNSLLQKNELLQAIVKDFGIKAPEAANLAELLDILHRFFLDANKDGSNCAIIIDEAHLLDFQAMEVLRMLSNLEQGGEKIVQILLTGQPELRENLDQPQMRQFRSRINVYHELPPLGREETGEYVNYKLSMAGAAFKLEGQALGLVRQASQGNFRRINLLMEKSLYALAARDERGITHAAVMDALKEVASWDKDISRRLRRVILRRAALMGGAGTLAILLLATGLAFWTPWKSPHTASQDTPPSAALQDDGTPPPARPDLSESAAVTPRLEPPGMDAVTSAPATPEQETQTAQTPETPEAAEAEPEPEGPSAELRQAATEFLEPWSLEELAPALYQALEADDPTLFATALDQTQTTDQRITVVSLQSLPATGAVRFSAFPWQLHSESGPAWIALWQPPISLRGYALEFRSPEVIKLQERLDQLGYYRLGIDGTVGPGTWKAMENFQRDHGLQSTGKPDPTTLFWLYTTAMRARPAQAVRPSEPRPRPAPSVSPTPEEPPLADPTPPEDTKSSVDFGIE